MIDYRALIRQKRKEKGWSQQTLADKVSLAQPFIHEIETGKKDPSVETLIAICEALEIKLFPDET